MQIRQDDLTGTEIIGFLREHLNNMNTVTPPGSVHPRFILACAVFERLHRTSPQLLAACP